MFVYIYEQVLFYSLLANKSQLAISIKEAGKCTMKRKMLLHSKDWRNNKT